MNAHRSSSTIVVVTGAAPLDRRAVAAVPRDALVIAADGGLDHARAAGLDARRARRRPRLDLGPRAGLGVRARRGRAPPGRQGGDRHRAGDRPRRRRSPRRASCSSPARATASTTPSPRSARSARRRSPASPSLEAWWGSDQLHVVHGPGTPSTLDLPAGHDVLGARHARPVRAASRSTAPAGRSPTTTLEPLVGLGVSNVADDRRRTSSVGDGIVTVVVPGAAS